MVEGRVDGGVARPATIYDVARMAGVSHQTVSRLLRGEGLKPANRQRVLDALQALDYRPNLSARSLASSRSHRIAVLTGGIGLFGPGRIVQGAVDEARRLGYLLDVVTVDVGNRSAVEESLRELGVHELAGIVALASTDELIDLFATTTFAVPAVIGAQTDRRGGTISELTTTAIPLLVDHLAEMGHRQFLHIAGPRNWPAARNRERAFRSAVRGHPGTSLVVVRGDWSAQSGFDAIANAARNVSAVVAANDQMALGAMRALSQAGLRIPDDVSVTGIDDIPEAAFLGPPLTSVRVDFLGQGRDMLRQALEVIDGRAPEQVVQSATLVVRESTSPAR